MLLKSTLAALVLIVAAPAASALPDDQGWDGPGWYISGGDSWDETVEPAYILFQGPHGEQKDCITLHDRYYAPIGTCRYLNVKPGSES